MKLVFCLIVIGGLIQGCGSYRLVCVYTNWSQYRPEGGKFLPEDIDPMLCTHIIYVYAKLKSNKLEPAEWNDESTVWNEGMYEKVTSLKHVNADLKVLLGVGGWMMGSKDFSRMAASAGSRKLFAKTTAKYLRDRKFDGLSIDWQHPTKRGGQLKDKANFPLLLKEVRKEFEEESKSSGLPSLMLVISVAASKEIIDDAYEIDNITRYTDFINVLAYDLHGPWDNYTGHPSQLYPRKQEFGPSAEINVDATMKYWISRVQNRSQLNLGVSTYARTYTLRKVRHNDFNVPTTGPGVAGEFTQQPGMLAYYERCTTYADAKRVWDPASQVAYWYSGDQWIAGEDIESLKSKVNWTRSNTIGGILIWTMDTDDFSGGCKYNRYPLLTAARSELARSPLITVKSEDTREHTTGIHTSESDNIYNTTTVAVPDDTYDTTVDAVIENTYRTIAVAGTDNTYKTTADAFSDNTYKTTAAMDISNLTPITFVSANINNSFTAIQIIHDNYSKAVITPSTTIFNSSHNIKGSSTVKTISSKPDKNQIGKRIIIRRRRPKTVTKNIIQSANMENKSEETPISQNKISAHWKNNMNQLEHTTETEQLLTTESNVMSALSQQITLSKDHDRHAITESRSININSNTNVANVHSNITSHNNTWVTIEVLELSAAKIKSGLNINIANEIKELNDSFVTHSVHETTQANKKQRLSQIVVDEDIKTAAVPKQTNVENLSKSTPKPSLLQTRKMRRKHTKTTRSP